MGKELIDYFLKWFIPFLSAGLFGLLITPLIKDYKSGRKVREQRQWNEQAAELKTLFEKSIGRYQELQSYIESVEQVSNQEDILLRKQLTETKEVLIREIQNRTAGMREALLSIHLNNLIRDSIRYIEQGWVSAGDLQDYNERYITYRELGGNGHMDPWYPKVKRLPNLPPEE